MSEKILITDRDDEEFIQKVQGAFSTTYIVPDVDSNLSKKIWWDATEKWMPANAKRIRGLSELRKTEECGFIAFEENPTPRDVRLVFVNKPISLETVAKKYENALIVGYANDEQEKSRLVADLPDNTFIFMFNFNRRETPIRRIRERREGRDQRGRKYQTLSGLGMWYRQNMGNRRKRERRHKTDRRMLGDRRQDDSFNAQPGAFQYIEYSEASGLLRDGGLTGILTYSNADAVLAESLRRIIMGLDKVARACITCQLVRKYTFIQDYMIKQGHLEEFYSLSPLNGKVQPAEYPIMIDLRRVCRIWGQPVPDNIVRQYACERRVNGRDHAAVILLRKALADYYPAPAPRVK